MANLLLLEPATAERERLARALGDAGHRVTFVDSADAALAAWRSARHELALIDESAPPQGGLALATRLKSEMPQGFLPAIMLTARPEVAARVAALTVADDVVTRPYLVEEVVARVGALLRTRRIVDELRAARADSEARNANDPVTGLPNRAVVIERLDEEWRRAARFNQPLALLLVSIDDWRLWVESRGQPFAERFLRGLAQTTTRALRQVDVSGRYGPSDLVALLPNTHVAGALICAERLRKELAATLNSDGERASASMGIAVYPGKDVNESGDLLRLATRALERAREEGPGAICLYQHQGYLFQPK